MLKWPKHSYISLTLSNSKNAMRIQKMRCRLCDRIGSVCEPERLHELVHRCWRRFSIQKTKGVCARKTVLWRWKVACCSIPLTGSSFKGSRNQPQIFFSTRKRKWNVAQLSTILEQLSHPRNVGQWLRIFLIPSRPGPELHWYCWIDPEWPCSSPWSVNVYN